MIISLNSLICIVRGNFQISLILDHANTTFQSFTKVYSKIYIGDEKDECIMIVRSLCDIGNNIQKIIKLKFHYDDEFYIM